MDLELLLIILTTPHLLIAFSFILLLHLNRFYFFYLLRRKSWVPSNYLNVTKETLYFTQKVSFTWKATYYIHTEPLCLYDKYVLFKIYEKNNKLIYPTDLIEEKFQPITNNFVWKNKFFEIKSIRSTSNGFVVELKGKMTKESCLNLTELEPLFLLFEEHLK